MGKTRNTPYIEGNHETFNRQATQDEMPTQLFRSEDFQQALQEAEWAYEAPHTHLSPLTELAEADLEPLDDDAPSIAPSRVAWFVFGVVASLGVVLLGQLLV